MHSDLAGFLVAVAVITLTPGADTALVIRNALAGGRRAGMLTALGGAIGLLCWGVAAAIGLAAVLAASAMLYTAVKLAGAAYLVYLGIQAIRHAGKAATAGAAGASVRHPVRIGLMTNLLNPKAGLFFTALLPQFVSPHDPVLVVSAGMTLVAATASLVWLCGYSALVARAGDVLRRPRVARAVDRCTGAVLIALGLRVALSRR